MNIIRLKIDQEWAKSNNLWCWIKFPLLRVINLEILWPHFFKVNQVRLVLISFLFHSPIKNKVNQLYKNKVRARIICLNTNLLMSSYHRCQPQLQHWRIYRCKVTIKIWQSRPSHLWKKGLLNFKRALTVE